ncbi:MAG: hypothetical protein JNL74_14815 [Fibrobacteres bacterium]|nr:hypothetical protein [Fibrobacterota bacterium]
MVRTLAIRLYGSHQYIVTESRMRSAIKVIKCGKWTEEPYDLGKIDKIICEFEQGRFVCDPNFASQKDDFIQITLSELCSRSADREFLMRRLSPYSVMTLRSKQYQTYIDTISSIKLTPYYLAPAFSGLAMAICKLKDEGIYLISALSLAFVIKNKQLLYYGTKEKAEQFASMIGIQGESNELTANALNLTEVEPGYFSLLGLASYADTITPEYNFLQNNLIETGLEKVKMRKSIFKALLFILPLFLLLVFVFIQSAANEKRLERIETHYNVYKKRVNKVVDLKKTAEQNLQQLLKLNRSGGASSVTSLLLTIAAATPAEINIQQLQQERSANTATLTGTATDMASVFLLEATLKKGIYKNSRVVDTRKLSREGASETVLFKMSIAP